MLKFAFPDAGDRADFEALYLHDPCGLQERLSEYLDDVLHAHPEAEFDWMEM